MTHTCLMGEPLKLTTMLGYDCSTATMQSKMYVDTLTPGNTLLKNMSHDICHFKSHSLNMSAVKSVPCGFHVS